MAAIATTSCACDGRRRRRIATGSARASRSSDAADARLWQIVKTGSSYASQSELPLTFGLGSAAGVDAVRVTWPSGRVDVGAADGQSVDTVREGRGVAQTPRSRARTP